MSRTDIAAEGTDITVQGITNAAPVGLPGSGRIVAGIRCHCLSTRARW